ncbi:MAG: efflux RND transporter periplasmic adaptor subunit [Chitinophagales bacterium]
MSKFTWVIVALVLLIAGIIVYNKVLHPKEGSAPAPAGGPPKEMAVNAYVVKPKSLSNNIMASGTLLAYEDVELHPEVSGKITVLNLQEGKPVSKGALLVKLYDADLQAQLKKLQVQRVTADKTVQRLKQLLAINGIGQQEYDNAVLQLDNIDADMQITEAAIAKTEVRAPFSGVVGLKNVSLGAVISPATTIATLQQVDELKVDFTVPEKYTTAVHVGDVIKFTVDGQDETFNGKVFAIEPKIDEATRSIKIRAQVQNAKAKLYPGAFAKIDLGLQGIENAFMVPTQSIIPEARNKKLIVVKDGKAEFRVVQTGVRSESYIQITDGVSEGDTVVTTAIMYVKPGMGIKVTKVVE